MKITAWSVLFVAMSAGTVWAEPAPRMAAADPTLTSSLSIPSTAAVLRASKGDTDVAIQGSAAVRRRDNVLALGVKVAGPLGGSTPSKLATLDGLQDSTTLELGILGMRWKISAPDARRIAEVCQKYLQKEECSRSDLPSEEAKRELDDAVDYGQPVLVRLSGRLGYRSIDYVDESTLASARSSGFPWAVTLGLGTVIPGFGYAGLGYRRERSLATSDTVQLCTPIGMSGSLQCADSSLGPPIWSNKNVLTAEARVFLGWVAANPMITFDVTNRITGLQMPIFLVKGSDSALIAGITPSWRSDTKDVAAFLFVGGALSLLPAGMKP